MNLGTLFAAAVLVASCAGAAGDHCSTPPLGSVNVFFAGGAASRDTVASVATITPLEELGGFRYDMSDGSRLTWMASERIPSIEIGRPYRFVVEYAGGFPDASGILVFEGGELLFAAFTDQQPFQHVLEQGIPGFAISAGAPACASRERSKCYDAIVNVPLSIEHGGERKTFHQGESARMGEFEVRVLTAQMVRYSSRCADAGLPGVSLALHRVR